MSIVKYTSSGYEVVAPDHWDLLRLVKIRPSSSLSAKAWLLAIAQIHIMIPNRGYCIKKLFFMDRAFAHCSHQHLLGVGEV